MALAIEEAGTQMDTYRDRGSQQPKGNGDIGCGVYPRVMLITAGSITPCCGIPNKEVGRERGWQRHHVRLRCGEGYPMSIEEAR